MKGVCVKNCFREMKGQTEEVAVYLRFKKKKHNTDFCGRLEQLVWSLCS